MNNQKKQHLKPKIFLHFVCVFMPKSVIVDCFLLLQVSSVIGSAFDVSAFFDVNFIMELVLLGSFSLCLELLASDSNAFIPCPAMEIVLKQTEHFAKCLSPTFLNQGLKSSIDNQSS